jgi:sialic acid synthase SpsE
MKIIAECGVNFDTVDQVFAMIGKSKEAGCAYTKFQLYDETVIKDSPLREELQKRMITREFAELLVEEGEADGQPVFFTPMFLEAVDWIADMHCPLIKIRFADRYNFPLVDKALEVGVPVLISADHRYLNYCQDPRVKLLYCISRYPAAPEDYHIVPEDFSTGSHTCAPVFRGVSDHTKRLVVIQRAKDCGAEFCEVHVMLEGTHPIDETVSKTFAEVKGWTEQS